MSTFSNPRLITPPREEEEIYPYRRVWRSLVTEQVILTAVTVGLFLAGYFLGIGLPQNIYTPVNIGLALLPAGLWLWFSRVPEQSVLEPRRNLLTVFIISALVARSIGIPLINDFLQPETWLSLESAVNRIIGYTVTVGITHEALKYVVLRYTIHRDLYRVRVDSIAYSVAVAMGYAMMLNLHYVADNLMTPPHLVVVRIFTTTALHLATSAIVSYGVVETWLSNATIFLLPLTLFMAAAVSGAAIPLRSGLVNTGLDLTGGTTRPLFGMVFALALLVVPLVIVAFLYRAADRREADKIRGQEG
jgi:hypothetical protein